MKRVAATTALALLLAACGGGGSDSPDPVAVAPSPSAPAVTPSPGPAPTPAPAPTPQPAPPASTPASEPPAAAPVQPSPNPAPNPPPVANPPASDPQPAPRPNPAPDPGPQPAPPPEIDPGPSPAQTFELLCGSMGGWVEPTRFTVTGPGFPWSTLKVESTGIGWQAGREPQPTQGYYWTLFVDDPDGTLSTSRQLIILHTPDDADSYLVGSGSRIYYDPSGVRQPTYGPISYYRFIDGKLVYAETISVRGDPRYERVICQPDPDTADHRS